MTYLSNHVRYLLSAICPPLHPYHPLLSSLTPLVTPGGPCPVHVSHYWDIPSSYSVSVPWPVQGLSLYFLCARNCASRKAPDDECAPWLDATVSGVSDQLST